MAVKYQVSYDSGQTWHTTDRRSVNKKLRMLYADFQLPGMKKLLNQGGVVVIADTCWYRKTNGKTNQ